MRYVSRSLQLEYLEIAKSACTSIKVALLKADEVDGNITEQVHTNHHWRDVPDETPVQEVFTLVRHPFERLISSWRQKLQTGQAKQLCGRMPLSTDASFVDWVKWVTSEDPKGCDKHWLPQAEMLARHERRGNIPQWIGQVDVPGSNWRSLQLRYPGLPDLTRENVSNKDRGDVVWDCEAWWSACRFYAHDLARFGYSADPYRPAGCNQIPVVPATRGGRPETLRKKDDREFAKPRSDDDAFFKEVQPIGGWMFRNELLWLRERAGERDKIVEIGVWKGRSLFALAYGARGKVIGVDHWLGSPNERALTHSQAATEEGREAVYAAAQENLKQFVAYGKCELVRMESTAAAANFQRSADPDIDMLFIDSGHDFDSCHADLNAWVPRVKPGGLICGHDYKPKLGCFRAVNERFGANNVKRGAGSIWYIEPEKEKP